MTNSDTGQLFTQETDTGTSIVGQETGRESSLSNWAGPYVTSMLGKGAALSNEPYQGYSGPLTAGESNLQNQAFQGIAGLTVPIEQIGNYQPQSFTQQGTAQQYMNPYINGWLFNGVILNDWCGHHHCLFNGWLFNGVIFNDWRGHHHCLLLPHRPCRFQGVIQWRSHHHSLCNDNGVIF